MNRQVQIDFEYADRIPATRATDPVSSAEAEDEINITGHRKHQLRTVLEALRQYPNSTTRELAAHRRIDRYMVGRRMPELEKLGHVARVGMRECRLGRRNATIWKAV